MFYCHAKFSGFVYNWFFLTFLFLFLFFLFITLNPLGNELCILCWSNVFLLFTNFEVTFIDYVKPLLWVISSNKFDYGHMWVKSPHISVSNNDYMLELFFGIETKSQNKFLKTTFQLFLQRNLWPCVFHSSISTCIDSHMFSFFFSKKYKFMSLQSKIF